MPERCKYHALRKLLGRGPLRFCGVCGYLAIRRPSRGVDLWVKPGTETAKALVLFHRAAREWGTTDAP